MDNLIILCPTCHSEVDKPGQDAIWTVDRLNRLQTLAISKATTGWRPWQSPFVMLHYVNLDRLLMMAALKGVEVDPLIWSSEEAPFKEAQNIVLWRLHAVERLLPLLSLDVLPLADRSFAKLPLGAIVYFNRRVFCRGISTLPIRRLTTGPLSASIAERPHLYIKARSQRLTLPIRPEYLTSGTAHDSLRGTARLAGLFQVKGRLPAIGKERSHLLATPLVIGLADINVNYKDDLERTGLPAAIHQRIAERMAGDDDTESDD